MRKTLTYDDVNIVPKYSELESRENVKLNTRFTRNTELTIHDRENKPKPIVTKAKYGRNEIVGITDGKDYKEVKYKKAKPLLDSGQWTIYIGGPIT